MQKYLHDLQAWNALPVEAQEKVIGRMKLSDIELDDAVQPPDSHVARTTIVDPDGTERQILRDNMPCGWRATRRRQRRPGTPSRHRRPQDGQALGAGGVEGQQNDVTGHVRVAGGIDQAGDQGEQPQGDQQRVRASHGVKTPRSRLHHGVM